MQVTLPGNTSQFTLIELLVVIAIIAILAPRFLNDRWAETKNTKPGL